ncbi:conserved hypothetical protein [Terrimicrobium sacchariphilum]|jgi:uncharacterized protein (TIGR02246 family)|uniref:DUF4440 domain-containing protein n=1 Tax=Terrimicrobium sacchariphilum TaxID=690879 RepID=A0A146G2U3_TERSA|nr:SgcJ/EcaC family oxidoreductase [Terrimicrobium sacchariphilum]GAT31803.1 conserved hypothetical protein [Terrimicrobium sacchariphilum]
MKRCTLILALLASLTPFRLPAADASDNAAIAAIGEAYVKAFNDGNAKAISAFWLPNADYIDLDGVHHKGREAITKLFADFFAANKGVQVRIDSEALSFPTPDTAVEDGLSVVTNAQGGAPSVARYSNLFVRKDGKWFLATVRETPAATSDRSTELGALGWMIGDWQAVTKQGEKVLLSVEPGPNGNFLIIRRTILSNDTPVSGSVQWIAWDASTGGVRSWDFEDDGGFGESQWKPQGDAWTVDSVHTLRNGTKLSSSQTLTPNKNGSVTVTTANLAAGDQKAGTPEDLVFTRPTQK